MKEYVNKVNTFESVHSINELIRFINVFMYIFI